MRILTIFLTVLAALSFSSGTADAVPLIGAVLTGGAGLGAAFGATALGTFMTTFTGRLLSSVALSALSRAMASKPKSAGMTTEETATGGTNPCGFILGKMATAGDAVCPPMTHGNAGGTPNAYLTYVVALGDIRGQTLLRVAINSEFVTLGSIAHADYGLPVTGKFAGYAWVKYHDGSQTAADPMLLAKYGSYPERPWQADMIGRDIPYAIVTFRYNRDLFQSFPKVLFECGGIRVYDPRRDDSVGGVGPQRWGQPETFEPSTNNAVLIYNIQCGIFLPGIGVWGGDLGADSLPVANWTAAMNECDVTTGSPAVPQYRAGFEVRVDAQPAAVIEELLKGCLGKTAESGGAFKIRVGGPGLPVYFMTDDDIIVSKPQDLEIFPTADRRFNGIDAKYPDPEAIWAVKSAPSRYNAAWELEDGDRRMASLDLPACPYPDQIQRVMTGYIADERRFRKHALTMPPDAAILEPLDVVSWSSQRNGYEAKLFDVEEVGDDLRTLLQRLSLREVDHADYDWSSDWLVPTYVPSAVAVDPLPQSLTSWAVQALVLTDGSGTARRPAIRMSWDAAEMDAVAAVQYQLRVKNGGMVGLGDVTDVLGGEIIVAEGVVGNVIYQARGKPVAPGRATTWTAWIDVTSPSVLIGAIDIDGRGLDILDIYGDEIFSSNGRIAPTAYVTVDGSNIHLSEMAANSIVPSINFIGTFATAPTSVDLGTAWKQNAVYKNSTDGKSYILTGTSLAWAVYLEDGKLFSLSVESSNGTIFRVGGGTTTMLKARIFKNGAEVTSETPDAWFRWRRVSLIPRSPPNDDATFNANYLTGYKQISISVDAVSARATFFCDIIST